MLVRADSSSNFVIFLIYRERSSILVNYCEPTEYNILEWVLKSLRICCDLSNRSLSYDTRVCLKVSNPLP